MSKTPEIKRLVVNGCSYMDFYAQGNGHKELADKFNIPIAESLAKPGGSNQRTFRTTLADCYNNEKTLYVIGLTFIHRYELPILALNDKWNNENHEGDKFQWINDQQLFELGELDDGITESDVRQFHKLKMKFEINSETEVLFNTVFLYTSMIDTILNNGHQVIVFNTAETTFKRYYHSGNLKFLERYKNIVDKFNWYSNSYQLSKGAKTSNEDIGRDMPSIYKHIAPGEHKHLNEFLYDYINNNLYV